MKTELLKDLFRAQLEDMYFAEKQLVKALPKMAKAASSMKLSDAISKHLEDTKMHVKKIEEVFSMFDMTPKAKKCEAIMGLLKEGESIVKDFKGSPALDAGIICAAQKVEHYEIATYGCLAAWAGELGNEDAAAMFKEIHDEERTADETLTSIALRFINEAAQGGNGAMAPKRQGSAKRKPAAPASRRAN